MSSLKRVSTLRDIARHSNKVVRLSRLMAEMDAPYLINKMGFISDSSEPFDIIKAIDDDLGTTAKMLKDVSLMVDTLDENHIATEFKGEDGDFTVLFPDNYDPSTQTLTLFGFPLKPSNSENSRIDNNDLKKFFYNKMFESAGEGFGYDDFKKHYSVLKKLKNNSTPDKKDDFSEVLAYASKMADIEKWLPFYSVVAGTTDDFHKFRQGLSKDDRKIVEKKFYGGDRAMIYGVVATSTYVSKKDGIEQVSSKHKKQLDVVNKIAEMLKDIPCVSAVEIDQDSDIEKFHDMLVDVKSMRLDVADSFELKSRKLGNYKASGINAKKSAGNDFEIADEYGFASPDLKIIGVDVNAPTSLPHEIAHFRDRDYDDTREAIVDHFGSKIDVDYISELVPKSKVDYYLKSREIIARIGEIGFALSLYGYKEGESIEDFLARSEGVEPPIEFAEEKIGYSVALSKSFSTYAGEHPIEKQMYFNLREWTPEELSIVKDYTHSFYYKNDPVINERLQKKIDSGELDYQSRMYHQKVAKKHIVRPLSEDEKVGAAFGRITPSVLSSTYESGVQEGVFIDGEFMLHLDKHAGRIGKGGSKAAARSGISMGDWISQIDSFTELADKIDVKKRPGDALLATQFMSSYLKNSMAFKEDELPSESIELGVLTNLIETNANANLSALEGEMMPLSPLKMGKSYYTVRRATPESLVASRERMKDSLLRLEGRVFTPDFPYQKLRDADPMAKRLGLNVLMKERMLPEKGYLPEDAGDLQYDLAVEQSSQYFISDSVNDVALAKVIKDSGISELVPLRKIMSQLSKHEESIVSSLLKDDFLSKNGGKEKVFTLLIDEKLESLGFRDSADLGGYEAGAKLLTGSLNELDHVAVAHAVKKTRDSFGVNLRSYENAGSKFHELGLGGLSFVTKALVSSGVEKSAVFEHLCNTLRKESPVIDTISEEIKKAVDVFDKANSVKKIKHSKVTALSNHPISLTAKDLMINQGLTSVGIPSEVNPEMLMALNVALGHQYIDFGDKKIGAFIENGDIKGGPSLYLDGETPEMARDSVSLSLTAALKSLITIDKQDSDIVPAHERPIYGRALKDIEEINEKLSDWVSLSNYIDPEYTPMLLVASQSYAHPKSGVDYSNELIRNVSNTLSDLSKTVSLPFLISGDYFKDPAVTIANHLPKIDDANNQAIEVKPEVESSSVEDLEPKISEPVISLDEVINQEVKKEEVSREPFKPSTF